MAWEMRVSGLERMDKLNTMLTWIFLLDSVQECICI